MQQGLKNIITVRAASSAFVILALAVFKPFGLEGMQWQAYMHLLNLFVVGFFTCMVSDLILKYIVRMPISTTRGVGYIIRRNLWFQLINTPLIALSVCLYRHFILSERVEANHLSWGNYFESLLIIAFCSFAIGLYWRFKYRSKYLAAELEEMHELNEKLKEKAERPSPTEQDREQGNLPENRTANETITLNGTTNESVTLNIAHLLYIEAVGNYVKVCHLREDHVRADMLRATSKQMEDALQAYPMIVRCHRAFLVNLGQVEQIVAKSGTMQLAIKHSHESIPVSRSNMSGVKEAIKGITSE